MPHCSYIIDEFNILIVTRTRYKILASLFKKDNREENFGLDKCELESIDLFKFFNV